MFLSKLIISGYKIFDENFNINFNQGLNILVGENGSGKSAIVDAIRLILLEDEYGRAGITHSDFHRSHSEPSKSKGSDLIKIKCEFENLDENEQVVYLPWLDLNNSSTAYLNMSVENKEDDRGKYRRKIWGNESESGLFEWELLNGISCIYLPPLRDAEEKLRAYRGSRLARLLKNLNKNNSNTQHPLEKKFSSFNQLLVKDESIKEANESIKKSIKDAVGNTFGQDVLIQFSEINFDRIVERLRLLFYPFMPQSNTSNPTGHFRELVENSLGYNNILYLATILAELEGISDTTYHKVLLIEEPEAHLHPQLQIRLFKYLQEKSKEGNIQIIVTTHSPTIASSVDLDTISVLTKMNDGVNPNITALRDCKITPKSKHYLTRWLDITKSVLLFAKGVILVEGISEAIVIKELSRIHIKKLKEVERYKNLTGDDLEDFGISIINLGGIQFDHFLSIFNGYVTDKDKKIVLDQNNNAVACDFLPVRCACITDCDPSSEDVPTQQNPCECKNHQLYLTDELEKYSSHCRMFSNLKTFEYDLALEGKNLQIMAKVREALITTNGSNRKMLKSIIEDENWQSKSEEGKSSDAIWFLNNIKNEKGEFALSLAQELSSNNQSELQVPDYIKRAINWVLNV